jgi:hypothetical protein
MGGRRQTTLRARTPRSARRGSTSSRTRTRRRTGTTAAAHITTDHDTIREWAEARGGWPATVTRTARGDTAGILRIDFPDYSGESTLKPVSWDDWFDKFEENNLGFLYQERTAEGRQSRFFKLIERE